MSGEELRRRREALGMTQRALARHLGIHHNLIWSWQQRGVPAGRAQMISLAIDALEKQPKKRTQGTGAMKAWIVCDDIHDACDVVRAETAGRARTRYGSEYCIDRWDLYSKRVRVRRAPKCDGFEGSDDQFRLCALISGYFAWISLGCGCTITADEASEVVVSNGHTWCCEAHREGLPGGAKGNRHYA